MHQILFRIPQFLPFIGGMPIYGYGVMLVVGFFAAIGLAKFLARRSGIDPELFANAALIALVAGIAGARLSHVVENWHDYTRPELSFGQNFWNAINIRSGGLTYYGGFLLAFPAVLAYGIYKKVPVRLGMDIIAPCLMLGLGFGRIGCFLNGCCYGGPTNLPWACRFHDPPITGPLTPPSHPTQIYASIVNLGIFGLLLWIFRRQRATGQVLWSYLLFYAVYRFGIEFLRKGVTAQVFAAGLTQAQWASIGMVLAAGAVFYWLSRHGEGVQAFKRPGVEGFGHSGSRRHDPTDPSEKPCPITSDPSPQSRTPEHLNT